DPSAGLAVMGATARGTLVARYQDFEEGALVDAHGTHVIALQGGRVGHAATGTDATQTRVLVIGPDGAGWLDPGTDPRGPLITAGGWVAPAHDELRNIVVHAGRFDITSSTGAATSRPWWQGDLDIGSPVGFACDATRCAIVGQTDSETRVAVIDGKS